MAGSRPERRYEANATHHVTSTAEVLASLGAHELLGFHRQLAAALRRRPLTSLDYSLGGRLSREFDRLAASPSWPPATAGPWLHYAHTLHNMEPVQSEAREIAQQLLCWLPPPVQSSPPAAARHGFGKAARFDEQMDAAVAGEQREPRHAGSGGGWQQWRAERAAAAVRQGGGQRRRHGLGLDAEEEGERAAGRHPRHCDVCRVKGRAGCWLAEYVEATVGPNPDGWAQAYKDAMHTATEAHVLPPPAAAAAQAHASAALSTPPRAMAAGARAGSVRLHAQQSPEGRAAEAEAAAERLGRIMNRSSPLRKGGIDHAPHSTTNGAAAAAAADSAGTPAAKAFYYKSTAEILGKIADLTTGTGGGGGGGGGGDGGDGGGGGAAAP
eukprot:SAG22_NODE_1275_length_4921_cov_1.871215_4_plen_382_part_01